MFADAVQRTGSKLIARLSRHRNAANFGRMLELAMASASYDKKPTIFFEHTQDLTDFHRLIMLRPVELAKRAA